MVDTRVAEVMARVEREWFLPTGQRRLAGADQPLSIGHGATCSQPTTVAHMLGFLDPRPGDRVLDVGAGSGWTTALLAELVAPGGEVIGVELEPELVQFARANLERAATVLTAVGGARVEQATPGVLGRAQDGPFDRILVSAEARELPQELVDQLAEGGRMVIPVRRQMLVVDVVDGVASSRAEGAYRFVPLR